MKTSQRLIVIGTVLTLSVAAFPVRQTLSAKTEETSPSLSESSVSPSSEAPTVETSQSTVSQSTAPVSSAPVSHESVKESSTESTFESVESTEASTSASSIEETEVTETPSSSTETAVAAGPAPASVIQPPATKEEIEENYQFSVVKNQTTQEFIATIGKDAQKIAWKEGLFASVMLAQTILETGSGNSQLARPPHHNLFGIKGSYKGKQVTFATQEDNGSGQLYTIRSGFRQYPSYKESLEDYAALLKKGISGNSDFYQAVWKEHAATYQAATKALTGTYATDTHYDKKLNALIETYKLTGYDADPEKVEKEEHVTKESAKKDKKARAVEPSVDTQTEGTEKNPMLTTESLQQVIELLPIPQRPAKQVPGQLTTQ